MPDKQFVANRWLSTKEGDGATYCTLYATGAGASEGPHKYKITVRWVTCVCACVCMCVRMCVRVCMYAGVCVCLCVCVSM